MTTIELQKKIRDELSGLGWSMADFVKKYDKNHKYKSKLTEESFKKQLARESTKPKLLKTYLDFIYAHEQWLRLGRVVPICTTEDILPKEFNDEMKSISKMITNKIEKW